MITSVNNTQPAFGKFSIVKVRKEAFYNDKSLMNIEDVFEQKFNKALFKNNKMKFLFEKFFKKNSPSYVFFLEQPNYASLMDKLSEFGGYSLEWLQMHTGVPIYKPMEENFYSFVVLTEDELEIHKIMHANVGNIAKEALNYRDFRTCRGEICDELTKEAFINHCLIGLFSSLVNDDVAEIYQLEDLSSIDNVVEKIFK